MSRKTAKAAIAEDRPLRILEAVLLGLCLCILALRVTYTEAPTVVTSAMMPANLADTLYSLTVSSVLIFAFVFWIVVRVYRGGFTYRFTGMEFGLVLFILAAVIAGVGASDKRAAINQTLTLLGPLFAALLLVQILSTDLRIRLVLAVIVGLSVVSAYQCAEQLMVSNKGTIQQYEQNPKELLDRLNIEPDTLAQFLFEHRIYSQDVRGFFTTSNSAASFSIVASFSALVLLLRRREDNKAHLNKPASLLLPALATLAAVAGLLLTKSKGGILAFTAGAVLFAGVSAFRRPLLTYRRLVLAIAVPLAILAAGAASYVMVSYGLRHGSLPGGNSMLVRWQYWAASAHMYADHPWTGVGLGNFSNYYPHYKPAPALESVSDPHNVMLSLLTQCGPLGLLGFLAMLFVPLWRVAVSPKGPPAENVSSASAYRKPALRMLFAVLGSLIVLRPMLIPTMPGDSLEVLLYEIITLYVAPAAAFLIGYALITAPLEQELPPPSVFSRTVLLAAMASAILAVLLHNLIDFAIFEPGVWMTFWVAMACLVAASSPHRADAPAARRVSSTWRIGIIAGAVLLVGVHYFTVWRPVWSTTVKTQNALQAASAGRFDQAHRDLEAASAIDPLSSVPANLNGRLYLQQYETTRQKQPALLEQAARYLHMAIEANPADYRNYEKLAIVYSQWQRWQDAHDWYLKAAELYPGCERLWFKLGQVADQLGKADALSYYTKAVEIEESYQQQFRRMYPTRPKVISRLGDKDLAVARNRIQELSGRTENKE